jgi:translation initiation factor eIF-2B subunit beta
MIQIQIYQMKLLNIFIQSKIFIIISEVILTVGNKYLNVKGNSYTVSSFIEAAFKKKEFQVIVTENYPSYSGHIMAKYLSKKGINTTLVSDCSVYAIMSKVTKVVIGRLNC